MRHWLYRLSIVVGMLSLSFSASANDELAENTVKRLFNDFYQIYQGESDEKQLRPKILEYYYANFDHNRIANIVLGNYRRRASKKQQQQFAEVFPDYLLKSISPQLNKYFSKNTDDVIKIISVDDLSRENKRVKTLYEGKQNITLNIRLSPFKSQKGYAILDVEVAGVSMLLTERDIIGGMLQKHNGDIDTFLQELKNQVAKPDVQT